MAGYTEARATTQGPDPTLVRDLVGRVSVPVIYEGSVRAPKDIHAALWAGAYAVVVGTAITNPAAITLAFVRATQN